MAKKKKNTDISDTVKVGATGLVGYSVLGELSGPGSKSVVPIAGSGLQLANVGQLAKTGLNFAKGLKPKKNNLELGW